MKEKHKVTSLRNEKYAKCAESANCSNKMVKTSKFKSKLF